jgi:hypothetical protein
MNQVPDGGPGQRVPTGTAEVAQAALNVSTSYVEPTCSPITKGRTYFHCTSLRSAMTFQGLSFIPQGKCLVISFVDNIGLFFCMSCSHIRRWMKCPDPAPDHRSREYSPRCRSLHVGESCDSSTHGYVRESSRSVCRLDRLHFLAKPTRADRQVRRRRPASGRRPLPLFQGKRSPSFQRAFQ